MLSPEDRIGPYVLIRKIGQGSFGVVWLAERRGKFVTTQVALKIPIDDEPDLDAVRREAQAWLQVSGHPNVLPVLDADEYNGHVVIASEYAPDGTIGDWMKRHGGKAPSIEAAVTMTCGILAGLEHLHNRRMIHRDLKPGNVLLQGETPRLTDFGVCRVIRSQASNSVAGTPAYMAPEMFDGIFSIQTDLWAAGVMLYKMLSGSLPFSQKGWGALYAALREDEPAPMPPEVPGPIRGVVARVLMKDPSARYASAGAMRSALLAPNLHSVLFNHEENASSMPRSGSSAGADRAPAIGFDLQFPGRSEPGRHQPRPSPPYGELPHIPGPGTLEPIGRNPSVPSSRFSVRSPSRESSGRSKHEADDADMVWVPPGEFAMGDGDQADNPRRRVAIDGFWIYRHPVTVAMYRRFCSETARELPEPPPWGFIENHPMVNIHWQDAVEYCKWTRVSLPTEIQWEKAARGTDARRFPWGGAWEPGRCRCSRNNYADAGSTGPVGAHPEGASPYGAMDMAGNVWEWCHEMIDGSSSRADGGSSPRRVLRGGSWEGNLPSDFRTSFRQKQFPTYIYSTIRFRCLQNGDPE